MKKYGTNENFDAGARAGKQGKPKEANPYEKGSLAYDNWEAGRTEQSPNRE